MDLVDWSEERFREIEIEFLELTGKLGVQQARAIPISALHGDNVVERGDQPWYDGPPLLTHLEEIDVATHRGEGPLRLPVQWVIRPEDAARRERRYAGTMAGGTLRPGDEVVVLPAGSRTTVTAVDTFDGPLESAAPPDSVTVQLADDLDVGRGEMICGVDGQPVAGRHIEATVCWMSESPLRAGEHLALKHTTRTVRAAVESIDVLLDIATLHEETPPDQLQLNDIARITLRTSAPVVADPYGENRTTGAFILVDEDSNDTVGAGMVRVIEEPARPHEPHSPGVTWHDTGLGRDHRWESLGTRGATVWLTGLPASGKSSVAAALERLLVESGHPAYFLDGDNLRHGLSGDLAFSPADRTENIRRVAHVARLMADAGMVSIASLVSPAHHDRALARELHRAAGLPFIEVYVDTPVEVCEERDPKGLYSRARAGKLLDFTGITAPYEVPENPDVRIRGAEEDAKEAALRILAALERAWG
jgi:bifunctional enzyme CysN/CysC